ncbi:hypothetical protein HUJ04_009435 [Dendroctonus ponderosae]
MNLLQIVFCVLTATLIVYSSLINLLEPRLPQFLSRVFRYGKFAVPGKSVFAVEVPKAWFKHFYILAVVEYICFMGLLSLVYFAGMAVPPQINSILNTLCGPDRIARCGKHNVYLAACLLTTQVFRRFYDTQKVSVFGEQSKMNLSHYVVGHLHYLGTILAVLCEAPEFAYTSESHKQLNLITTSISDKISVLIFLCAWKHQHILGNLRKNEDGDVVSNGYKIPQGDWFKYLSCPPHQTAEIIMYSCVTWILWYNVSWFFIFTWVLVNQVETILLSHWWYKEKFDDFPKERKALIPFLY